MIKLIVTVRKPGLLLLLLMLMFAGNDAAAQYALQLRIIEASGKALPGATIQWKNTRQSFIADSSGLLSIRNISPKEHQFTISFTGYEEEQLNLTFPLEVDTPVIVMLMLSEDEEEEVIVSATRSGRTLANTPTRLEVITGEELAEKANMKPGDIRMLLNETTGIQTQQTSATSFNAGIRIQGLEGRYTQLLRDGYPLYAGFSGGLSIMQIAPLDLKQVEVIKGSASTLYGGGAIAGLVNLVSKTPGENRALNFLVNATSAGGLDLSGFYSEKYGKAGLTVFASRNSNKAYDPADIGLSAIPKFERYTINPRLFLYGKRSEADIGFTYITEDRIGGSMNFIKDGSSGFYEHNLSERISLQVGIKHKFSEQSSLQLKNSYSRFDRNILLRGYQFKALQQSSFSELTWNYKEKNNYWIAGMNFSTEDLKELSLFPDPLKDYHINTIGVFLQYTWAPAPEFNMESGLRYDYVNQYGPQLLPRVSFIYKINEKLSSRLGGGFGYKTPTIFSEEAERIQFRNVLPINSATTENETSVGGNWDLNLKTAIGDAQLNLNQLFFFTRLRKPVLMLRIAGTGGKLAFVNANGHIDTKGIETNIRLTYNRFKLYLGYTYTDVSRNYDFLKSALPLVAPHRLNNVLMFEIEDALKLGLEAYYFSRQLLNDGSYGRPYWVTGFMAEKSWNKFSFYINFENFTDTRQTRFESIYWGPIDDPLFKDIYAPVEGFVINGGIKFNLNWD